MEQNFFKQNYKSKSNNTSMLRSTVNSTSLHNDEDSIVHMNSLNFTMETRLRSRQGKILSPPMCTTKSPSRLGKLSSNYQKSRQRMQKTILSFTSLGSPDHCRSPSLEENQKVFGSFCNILTQTDKQEETKMIGKYSRENQLISAAACTGQRAHKMVKEALACQNTKLLNPLSLLYINVTFNDGTQGREMRTSQLTSLMIACIMGQI